MVNPIRFILKKYFFVTPLFYSYGNAAEEILWAAARARLLGSKLVIIAPARYTQILGYNICNSELYNLEFNYQFNTFELLLKHIVSFIVNFIFFIKRLFALILKKYFKIILPEHYYFPQIGRYSYWPAHNINNDGLKHYEEDLIINELSSMPPPTINLSKKTEEVNKFQDLMTQINSKYVCLHVRDQGFHGDSKKRSYRNADINNYIPMIKMLINKGLTVIRIGDASMQTCNLTDDKYIESYDSKYKSELIDLLLIQNCEFFIGMQSGPTEIALLFKKPVHEVNMYNWFFSIPMKPTDRGLLKKLFIPGIGEVNTLSKRFSDVPYKFTNMDIKLSDDEITFIENTPIEILEATKEFYFDYMSGFNRQPNEALVSNKELYKLFAEGVLKSFVSNTTEPIMPIENEVHRLIFRPLISLGTFYCNSSFIEEESTNS
mgnify:CR=1 FL=1